MSNELIALATVGVALIAVILTSSRGLRQDMTQMETRLREDMGQLRENMKQVEDRLREEVKQSEGRLREDMSQLRAEMKGDLKQLGDRVARLEHGQAKLEGLLEGLREAISGRAGSG